MSLSPPAFGPTAHSLSDKLVWDLPVNGPPPGQDRNNSVQITLGQAFKEVLNRGQSYDPATASRILSLELESALLSSDPKLKITTASDLYVYGGARFNLQLLKAILSLHQRGYESSGSQWFWFASDSSADYGIERDVYSFFVVTRGEMALEEVHFTGEESHGFNKDVFEPPVRDHRGRFWMHDADREEAWIEYWYRKFYRETLTGQLMVLRPDRPALHHFPEGRWHESNGFIAVADQLLRVRRLLYILVALALTIAVLLLFRK